MKLPMTKEQLVQQHCDTPWEHMVAVVLLNQTSHVQVRQVLPKLLVMFPDAQAMANANVRDIERIIQPCGLHEMRARCLKSLSHAFLSWDGEDATVLPGIGRYGSDSYRIFWKGERDIDVEDKTLKRYLGSEMRKLPVLVIGKS